MFENRAGNHQFGITGQPIYDFGRGVGDIFQCLGQYLADPGQLITGEDFKNLKGHSADIVPLVGT